MRIVTLVFLGVCLVSSGSCVLAPVDDKILDQTAKPSPKRIKVMIIDTGISPIPEIKPFLSTVNAPKDLEDNHGHGTHVAGLVLYGPNGKDKVCAQVEIYSCKFYKPDIHKTSNCFKAAKNMGIDFVNFSGGGQLEDVEESEAIKDYPGIAIVAVGNEDVNPEGRLVKPAWDISKEPYYPASLNYPNMRIVGNGYSQDRRSHSSNYGLPGMFWRDGDRIWSFDKDAGRKQMSGSSQATAIYTHELLKAQCQRLRSAK